MVMEVKEKKICLDLSLSKAKEIRAMNNKEEGVTPKVPNQLEWRKFGALGQGIMVPDKGFTKQLKCLDEEFEVAWDWGKNRWEIWKFPKDGTEAYHVLTVQTKDKGYKELSADILLKLQIMEANKFEAGSLVKYFEEMDKQLRRKKAEEFRTKIRDIALDSFLNIHCMKIQVPKEYSIASCAHI